MTWHQRYRVRSYFRNSIWVFPVIAMIAAAAFPKFLTKEFVVLDFSAEAGMTLGGPRSS